MDRHDAERIADEIISDLRDRRGLKSEWAQIDDDIKAQIRSRWADIVQGETPGWGTHPEDRLAAALAQWKMEDTPVSESAQALARAVADLLVHYVAS